MPKSLIWAKMKNLAWNNPSLKNFKKAEAVSSAFFFAAGFGNIGQGHLKVWGPLEMLLIFVLRVGLC